MNTGGIVVGDLVSVYGNYRTISHDQLIKRGYPRDPYVDFNEPAIGVVIAVLRTPDAIGVPDLTILFSGINVGYALDTDGWVWKL